MPIFYGNTMNFDMDEIEQDFYNPLFNQSNEEIINAINDNLNLYDNLTPEEKFLVDKIMQDLD